MEIKVKLKLDAVTKNYVKYSEGSSGINKWYLPKEHLLQFPDHLAPEFLEVEVKINAPTTS